MEVKIRELENRVAKLERIIMYLSQRNQIPKYCDICHEIYDIDDESIKIYNCDECNKNICVDCCYHYCEICEKWNNCINSNNHALVFFCSAECIESTRI